MNFFNFEFLPIRLIQSALLLLSLIILGCGTPPEAIKADYLFENVNVVPLNEEIVLSNQNVAVRDGKIVGILDQSSDVIADERIDGSGRYMMPGLADMHIHVRFDPQTMFNLFLANGVTTIRNMRLGDGDFDHVKLRSDVEAGSMIGPRYLVSGPQLTPELLPDIESVNTMLDRHVEHGYDVIKIHQDLSDDVYNALISGAKEYGLRVVGHFQHQMPLAASLRMGSVAHVEEFLYTSIDGFGKAAGKIDEFLPLYYTHVEKMADPAYRSFIVQEVANSDIYVEATLIIYHMISVWVSDEEFLELEEDELLDYLPEKTREEYLNSNSNPYRQEGFPLSSEHIKSNVEILKDLLFELHEAGVPLLLGTDTFGTLVPGFSLHQELELMVSSGLSAYDALRMGTVNVAAYLGEEGTAGTIEVGKRADFILLEDNPLTDIRHAGNVEGVFTQGRWFSESDLASMLAEAKAQSASAG